MLKKERKQWFGQFRAEDCEMTRSETTRSDGTERAKRLIWFADDNATSTCHCQNRRRNSLKVVSNHCKRWIRIKSMNSLPVYNYYEWIHCLQRFVAVSLEFPLTLHDDVDFCFIILLKMPDLDMNRLRLLLVDLLSPENPTFTGKKIIWQAVLFPYFINIDNW